MTELKKLDSHMYELICQKLKKAEGGQDTCLHLKSQNQTLTKIHDTIIDFFELMQQDNLQ